jgi:hypothetical protein
MGNVGKGADVAAQPWGRLEIVRRGVVGIGGVVGLQGKDQGK